MERRRSFSSKTWPTEDDGPVEVSGGSASSTARAHSTSATDASGNSSNTSPANRPIPSVWDAPQIRRPGDIVDVGTVIKNWWAFPAVGFNSILEIPVQQFEVLSPTAPPPVGTVVVPNDVFGVPIRKDIVHKVYAFHRRALAGYQTTMQLYKWEWPGSNRKVRSQKKSGKGRMGRRKAHGKWEGSFTHALRPRDWRIPMNKRTIYKALKVMLSVKFSHGQITVVDSFNVQSHKTKYAVWSLRQLLGTNCASAMLVHEGNHDVNDNFRWATAHIAAVRRENVEGVSVYNLLKYHQLVITEAALTKLLFEIYDYPRKMNWLQKFATPDGKPAPVPDKVPGWNTAWVEKRERIRRSEFRAREYFHDSQNWQWSSEIKGALKIPRTDPVAGFRVKDFLMERKKPIWEKLESLYVDDEPLEDDAEDEEYEDLMETFESHSHLADKATEGVISNPIEIEETSDLEVLAGRRRS